MIFVRYVRCVLLAGLCTGLAVLPMLASATSTAPDCAGLAAAKLAGVTVESTDAVAAGAFTTPDGVKLTGLPAFCRVVGRAAPSSDSVIRFEVWLPTAENWNGRMWGVGNGNFAGSIAHRALANRVGDGYATVATDTGHQATADLADGRWANGHPERVIDFGHRGIHEAAVTAKHMVAAYYGRGASRSYFGACSAGGRQALMEIQRYPEDYDGVIAGAPSNRWTDLFIGSSHLQFKQLADPKRRVSRPKLEALRSAALAACDARDGVKDGLIEDPERCSFDPGVLACKGGNESDQCLTPGEVEAVRLIYAGVKAPSGELLYGGHSVGSEAGWYDMHFGEAPQKGDAFEFMYSFFSNFVHEDAQWDWRGYDMERDGSLARRKLASVLDAGDADLRRFAARGGKLILFHGWNDGIIPARQTTEYYRRIRTAMGADATDHAVRLFMAPGVEHCSGGPGPNSFGQFATGSGDPAASLGAALQRWVEQGIAPERVIASKRKNDRDPTSEVVRTRPLCAYPRVAIYRGQGSTDLAANFECLSPETLSTKGVSPSEVTK
jgi:hypothetical protein